MSRSLVLSFNSAVAKYSRLTKKVRKSIARGEFWRYTRTRRHQLLSKIERLKRRITELRLQLKFAGAGLAAGLIMLGTDASAQTTSPIGPFVENQSKNPLPPPSFDSFRYPAIAFADLDNDGDLDAVAGNGRDSSPILLFYRNDEGEFHDWGASGLFVTWTTSGTNPGRPALGDIDDDGDLDLVIGAARWDESGDQDRLFFYRNNGTPEIPNFESESLSESPFNNIYLDAEAWPAFTDYDKDGDIDFVLTGRYFDFDADGDAYLQFFRNEKEGHEPGQDIFLVSLAGSENNPLYMEPVAGSPFFAIAFADLDGDGDEDYFSANASGQITYKRNDNGVFVEQPNEDYVFQAGGASTGNPLHIDDIQPSALDTYTSFSFGDLDKDGDVDLILGTHAVGTLNSPYIFVENTGNGVMVTDRSYSNKWTGFSGGQDANSYFLDEDGDGDLDLLVTGSMIVAGIEDVPEERVGNIFFRNNNGTFEPTDVTGNPFASLGLPGAGELKMLDVDSDSDLDAVYITFAGSSQIDYRVNNDGTFVQVSKAESPFKVINDKNPFSIAMDLGDFDGDGLLDIVTLTNGLPTFYKNTGTAGNPQFLEIDWKQGLNTPLGPYNPKVIDLDSDGDNDLIIGKYQYFYYYENIGSPTEPEWVEYEEHFENQNLQNPFGDIRMDNSGLAGPTLADIDGDGDKDLFFSKEGTGFFYLYENQNPTPTVTAGGSVNLEFTPSEPLTVGPQITLEDEDRDKIYRVDIHITPYLASLDSLQLNGTHGNLSAAWDDVAGVLSITGLDTVTVYQEALRNVQYEFTPPPTGRKKPGRDSNGKLVTKTVTFTVLDADLTTPLNPTVFNISGDDGDDPNNSPPEIVTSRKTATVGGNIALILDRILSDPDDNLDLSTVDVTSQAGARITRDDNIVTIDYSILPGFQGTDLIIISVCDTNGDCTTQSFNVEISADVYVYTGMSPNGDGINDWFQVDFLPVGTQVAIYNRWGDVVFETNNYDVDDPANRFEGKNKNGTDLVAGTYYYKVKHPNPDIKVKSGYILLNR